MHHIAEHRGTWRQAYWRDEFGHVCQPFRVSLGSTDPRIGSSFQQFKNSVFPENYLSYTHFLTSAHSDAAVWPHCPHAFHFLRMCVLSLHKTRSQILPRNTPGICNLPAQAATKLPGRQRASTVVPRGWPQILTLFSVLGNESTIEGIAPFYWGFLHGCFLQKASVQTVWDHDKWCLKKMIENHFWASSADQ